MARNQPSRLDPEIVSAAIGAKAATVTDKLTDIYGQKYRTPVLP